MAISDNNVIGKENKLLWHIPEDFKWFKDNTKGKPIIMGRKTHESIGKVLPGRDNIVLSTNPYYNPLYGAMKCRSLQEAMVWRQDSDEIMIIGGEQIYRMALPLTNKLYITRVHIEIDGDAYFPEINMDEWYEESRKFCKDNYKYEYEFITMIRS